MKPNYLRTYQMIIAERANERAKERARQQRLARIEGWLFGMALMAATFSVIAIAALTAAATP